MPEPEKRYDEPPTLPLPSRWRLMIAAAAIGGFLYFLYDYESRRPTEPPAEQSRTQGAPLADPRTEQGRLAEANGGERRAGSMGIQAIYLDIPARAV